MCRRSTKFENIRDLKRLFWYPEICFSSDPFATILVPLERGDPCRHFELLHIKIHLCNNEISSIDFGCTEFLPSRWSLGTDCRSKEAALKLLLAAVCVSVCLEKTLIGYRHLIRSITMHNYKIIRVRSANWEVRLSVIFIEGYNGPTLWGII